MSKSDTKSSTKSSDSALAEKIRAQRAALDAHDAEMTTSQQIKSGATKNNCDENLRKCIESKCNKNYSKCATDSDTSFSDKLTACRKDSNCSAHEFTLFVNEIKEDKKQEIKLAEYNNVIDCGNRYNNCIIAECGQTFNKCLGKSAGDKAIAACKKIATECAEADSGLVGRIGSIFGTVRQDAEIQIKADEKKLYALRDKMRSSCATLGALFDDRSLDCVFTVNFFAGDDQITPKASKKLYAGSVFDCTPDWFGIDVTTFKENAYRLTRAQSAASSAMLGSGVGTAVGALTSGAIDRAIDSKKAKDALKDTCKDNNQKYKDGKCVDMTDEEKCEESGGKYKNKHCICDDDKKEQGGVCVDKSAKELCDGELQSDGTCKCKDPNKEDDDGVCVDKAKKKKCLENGGKKLNVLGKCICEDETYEFNDKTGKCEFSQSKKEELDAKAKRDQEKADKKAADEAAEKACEENGLGTYKKGECKCKDGAYPADDKKSCRPATEDEKGQQACTESGGEWKQGYGCFCKSENLLTSPVGNKTSCACSEGADTEFNKKDKRCYFTKKALEKCAQYGAKGDKAKGCDCPTPKYKKNTTPSLICVEAGKTTLTPPKKTGGSLYTPGDLSLTGGQTGGFGGGLKSGFQSGLK